jgi:hypothetical protein
MPWHREQLALNFCSPARNSAGAEATAPVAAGSTPFWLQACVVPSAMRSELTNNI